MKKRTMKLDKEEREILDAIERGEFKPVPMLKKELARHAKIARATLTRITKNKTISIRISEHDLVRIKQRAAKEGLPYQTFITSTLHKLV